MMLPAILTPEELEMPRAAQFLMPFVFIVPGAVLIYAGRKASETKRKQNVSIPPHVEVTSEHVTHAVDKAGSPIVHTPIHKQRLERTHSREEMVRLITEILAHADPTPQRTREQETRLTKLVKHGHDVVPEIESAIGSSVRSGNPEYVFENAGRLCEALGKMKGANAFNVLTRILVSDSPLQEYAHIRIGAVRGLMHLGNKRAIPLLEGLQDPSIPRVAIEEAVHGIEMKATAARGPDVATFADEEMLKCLRELCELYTWRTESEDRFATDPQGKARYRKSSLEKDRLESLATAIGEELNRRGGIEAMRDMWSRLNNIRGTRTLDMHWGGIGDWRG